MVDERKIQLIFETLFKNQEVIDRLKNKLNDVGSFFEKNAKKLGISTEEFEKNFKEQELIFQKASRGMVKSAINQSDAIENLEDKQTSLKDLSSKHGITVNELSGALSNQGILWQKNIGWVDKAGDKVQDLNGTIKTGKTNMRGFQSEQLGVMFAGMALNRTMANLSTTAREWTGVNELLSIAMGQLMLPTTLDLLNLAVIPLFNAFTDLPEPAKKAIGTLVLGLEGLGLVLMTGGQLALGASSLVTVLEKIGGPAGAAAGATKSLKKLGSITLVGVGVGLGISSVTAEDGTTALGLSLAGGVAIALGAVGLFSFAAATGIVIGTIAVAGFITARLLLKDLFIEGASPEELQKKVLSQVGEDIRLGEDVNQFREFGRGTKTIAPSTVSGLQDFTLDDFKFPGATSAPGAPTFVVNQNNTFNGTTTQELKTEVNKTFQNATRELLRISKTP